MKYAQKIQPNYIQQRKCCQPLYIELTLPRSISIYRCCVCKIALKHAAHSRPNNIAIITRTTTSLLLYDSENVLSACVCL